MPLDASHRPTRRLLLHRVAPSAFVMIGRGSTGALPVLVALLASRAFGLETMGRLSTALMLAYATAEVADGLSQRHVLRIAGTGTDASRVEAVAAFNGVRFLVLAAGLLLSALVLYPAVQEITLWPLAILVTAAWTTAANMYYALALTTEDYLTMGLGPAIALVALAAIAFALSAARPDLGIWSLTIALHGARGLELAFLHRRQRWPGVSLDRALLIDQWRATRYLLAQMLLTALHVRLVVPLVALLAGAAAAGAFAIALSLLGVVSLSVVAITVPAYRRAMKAGPPPHLAEAWRRTRPDFLIGLLVGGGMVFVLWLATPLLVAHVFGIDAPFVHTVVRMVLLGGLFESLALFGTVWYHACFRDRDLLVRSVIAVVGGWAALVIGHALAGAWGMACAFALVRVATVAIIYQPVITSIARDPASTAPTAA